jgi:hypothetical protein
MDEIEQAYDAYETAMYERNPDDTPDCFGGFSNFRAGWLAARSTPPPAPDAGRVDLRTYNELEQADVWVEAWKEYEEKALNTVGPDGFLKTHRGYIFQAGWSAALHAIAKLRTPAPEGGQGGGGA